MGGPHVAGTGLYGREEEAAVLQEAFQWASLGATECVFVSGQAGIGKSRLVYSSFSTLSNGLFVSGKYDQYQRDIPYKAFIECFRKLIRKLSAQPQSAMNDLRGKLEAGMGVHAAVLAEVVPELQALYPAAEKPEKRPPAEAQARLERAARKFLRLFASPDQALVLFLDDLQWADRASLELLHALVSDPESQFLLVVGAFRDDEMELGRIFPEPASMPGVRVREIALQPLGFAETRRIAAEMLAEASSAAEEPEAKESAAEPETTETPAEAPLELAQILHAKSSGNPLYFKQLVRSALRSGWIRLSPHRRAWEWDRDGIVALPGFEGQLDNLIENIHRLSPIVRNVMEAASCLGGTFSVEELHRLLSISREITAAALENAVQEGYMYPSDEEGAFQFAHDRIRQAAYQLLEDERRRELHLAAGRALQEKLGPQDEQLLFEVVYHLNEALPLMTAAERKELAALNARAAEKALLSSAYETALHHARSAIALSDGEDGEATFRVRLIQVQCEYLCSRIAEAEAHVKQLLQTAKDWTERARIMLVKINHYSNMGKYAEAIAIGLDTLAETGIQIDARPNRWQVLREVLLAKRTLDRSWDTLERMGETTDPRTKLVLELMFSLIAPAFLGDRTVFAMLSSRFIRYTLTHGASYTTPALYAAFGVLLGAGFGDYESGYRLGEIAVRLADKSGIRSVQCKTHMIFGGIIAPWVRHAKEGEAYLERAVQLGLESGDYVYASYAIGAHTNLVYLRAGFDEMQRVNRQYLQVLELTKDEFIAKNTRVYIAFAARLMNVEGAGDSLAVTDGSGGEDEFLQGLQEDESGGVTLFQYYTYKLQLHYWFGRYREALRFARLAKPYTNVAKHSVHYAERAFYEALSIAALWPELSPLEQWKEGRRLKRLRNMFQSWAAVCPANFMHKHLLLEAEWMRLRGREGAMARLYEQAMERAAADGYVRTRGLIAELAARYYAEQGMTRIAAVYVQEALHDYRASCMHAKAADLTQRYPALSIAAAAREEREEEGGIAAASGIAGAGAPASIRGHAPSDRFAPQASQPAARNELDLAAVMKDGVEWKRLLGSSIQALRERSGAERAYLFAARGADIVLAAKADGSRVEAPDAALEACGDVPQAAVRYAFWTKERMAVANACEDPLLADDPYIAANQCKSIGCLPLLIQERVIGAVVFEHRQIEQAFTLEWLDSMQVMAAQLAFLLRLRESFGGGVGGGAGIGTGADGFRAAGAAASAGSFIAGAEGGYADISGGMDAGGSDAPALVEPLTERELEVLQWMSLGFTNKEIAEQLGITPGTVKVHCHNIFGKLNVKRRAAAIAEAKKRNLV